MKNHDYFFKEEEIALIASSETMGNLPDILEEIARELENSERINGKIKKAITYPTVLVIFAIVAVSILLIYVIPVIVDMFPNKDNLPKLTIYMMSASNFLKNTRFLLGIILLGIILLYRFLYKYILTFKIFIYKTFLNSLY